ncbi:MAG: CU044_5270 family protein, partial [Streptomycetaceae bacterium]|nr:CU044_5270 family protein [Streptomycetaceae bacterium]
APTVSAADRNAAGALLDRAALAAEANPEVPVRDGQYEYIETYSSYAMFTGSGDTSAATMQPWSSTSTWQPVTGAGTLLQRGGSGPEHREEVSNAGQSLGTPNYRYLQTLPTDPDALLRVLREYAPHHGGNPRDQQTFTLIGDILRGHNTTPALTAALFRAAAKLDGVTIVRDVTDVLGRPGVAVTQNQVQGDREEWIFDPQTAAFIGERDVAVESEGSVHKGMVLGNMAVVKRGFVDGLGDIPQGDPVTPTRVVPTGPLV